jgi:hypothetical protein
VTIAAIGIVAGIGFPHANRRYMNALQKASNPVFTGLVGWWLRRRANGHDDLIVVLLNHSSRRHGDRI